MPAGLVPDGTVTRPCHWVETPTEAVVGPYPQLRQAPDGEQEERPVEDVVDDEDLEVADELAVVEAGVEVDAEELVEDVWE